MSDHAADYPHDTNGTPASGLSVSQAAAYLGLSVNAVRHKVRRGTLPAVKVNGEWRVQLVEGVPHRPAASQRIGVPPHRPADSPADTPQDRPASISLSAEQQLATLREGLVAPLVALTERQQAMIAELERERGRLEAERDHERQLREMAELEQASERALREALEARLRVLEAHQVESPTMDDDSPAAPGRVWWRFWERG